MKIKLAGTVGESIVDGPGLRFTIFAQGCPHRCEGCHNPHTHDFDSGKFYDTDELIAEICANPLLDGVTFSGGEPFCQPTEFLALAENLPARYNIYCYTGYTFEELLQSDNANIRALLSHIDVLVDGKFMQDQMSYELKFKGSKNQRILDCKKSCAEGRAIAID